jgi:capsule polysaccharide export protein KpsE/RkpR
VEYYALKENIFKFDSLLQQHGEQHPDVKRLKANKESMEKNIKEKVRQVFLHLYIQFIYIFMTF